MDTVERRHPAPRCGSALKTIQRAFNPAAGLAGAELWAPPKPPSGWGTGAIGRAWRAARDGLQIRRCSPGGGGRAALDAGGGKGPDRTCQAWPSLAGPLRAGVAWSGGGVAPISRPAWLRSRMAAEA